MGFLFLALEFLELGPQLFEITRFTPELAGQKISLAIADSQTVSESV